MAAYDPLIKYCLQQHIDIERYMIQCIAHADPEAIHQLRLSIKKLRTFHILAKQFGYLDQEPAYLTIKVKKLFKIAGAIRDTQVQKDLLKTYEEESGVLSPEFSGWLCKREAKHFLQLHLSLPKEIKNNQNPFLSPEVISIFIKVGDEAILKTSVAVIDHQYFKIRDLLASKLSDDDLHYVRKLAKQLRYLQTMVKHSFPDFQYEKISVVGLKEIETATGNWHDNLIRIELLKKFMRKISEKDGTLFFHYQNLSETFINMLNQAYAHACQVVKNEVLQ